MHASPTRGSDLVHFYRRPHVGEGGDGRGHLRTRTCVPVGREKGRVRACRHARAECRMKSRSVSRGASRSHHVRRYEPLSRVHFSHVGRAPGEELGPVEARTPHEMWTLLRHEVRHVVRSLHAHRKMMRRFISSKRRPGSRGLLHLHGSLWHAQARCAVWGRDIPPGRVHALRRAWPGIRWGTQTRISGPGVSSSVRLWAEARGVGGMRGEHGAGVAGRRALSVGWKAERSPWCRGRRAPHPGVGRSMVGDVMHVAWCVVLGVRWRGRRRVGVRRAGVLSEVDPMLVVVD